LLNIFFFGDVSSSDDDEEDSLSLVALADFVLVDFATLVARFLRVAVVPRVFFAVTVLPEAADADRRGFGEDA
jgi:hypothetical protein